MSLLTIHRLTRRPPCARPAEAPRARIARVPVSCPPACPPAPIRPRDDPPPLSLCRRGMNRTPISQPAATWPRSTTAFASGVEIAGDVTVGCLGGRGFSPSGGTTRDSCRVGKGGSATACHETGRVAVRVAVVRQGAVCQCRCRQPAAVARCRWSRPRMRQGWQLGWHARWQSVGTLAGTRVAHRSCRAAQDSAAACRASALA
jgi:hypothetical protein